MRLPEDILHFVKEARRSLHRLVLDLQRLTELLDQLPLLARHLRRRHHAHAKVDVSLAAMRIRQSLALLPENLSRLRPFRNFEILVRPSASGSKRSRPASPAESSPESCSRDPSRGARKTDAPSLQEKYRDRPEARRLLPVRLAPACAAASPNPPPPERPLPGSAVRSTRPCPRHEAHASRITCPVPWHAGQVRVIEKNPCW